MAGKIAAGAGRTDRHSCIPRNRQPHLWCHHVQWKEKLKKKTPSMSIDIDHKHASFTIDLTTEHITGFLCKRQHPHQTLPDISNRMDQTENRMFLVASDISQM